MTITTILLSILTIILLAFSAYGIYIFIAVVRIAYLEVKMAQLKATMTPEQQTTLESLQAMENFTARHNKAFKSKPDKEV